MAERRMLSEKIVESAKLLEMPSTSQNLYFHLIMNADDDGVVGMQCRGTDQSCVVSEGIQPPYGMVKALCP